MTEKNKGKKLLTWTLALSMTLALPPVGVFAEDGAGGRRLSADEYRVCYRTA